MKQYKVKINLNDGNNVSSGPFNVPDKTSDLTNDSGFVTTDTKNTAGSTNDTSLLYLIGAKTQADNPQTYSRSNTYINANGVLVNTSGFSSYATASTSYGSGLLYIGTNGLQYAGSSGPASLSLTSSTHGGLTLGLTAPTGSVAQANNVYIEKTKGSTTASFYLQFPNVGTSSSPKILATTDDIPTTYLSSASASGNTLTITPNSGSAITYTPSFSDTKVTQTQSTTNSNYPLLMAGDTTSTTTTQTTTTIKNYDKLFANPSTGLIQADVYAIGTGSSLRIGGSMYSAYMFYGYNTTPSTDAGPFTLTLGQKNDTYGCFTIGNTEDGQEYFSKKHGSSNTVDSYLLLPNVGTSSSPKTIATTDDIPTSYLASASVSENTLTITPNSGTAVTYTPSFSDTKNTAGSTNDSSHLLYLIGAQSQAANPQTYSKDSTYINANGYLVNTNGFSSQSSASSSYASLNIGANTLSYQSGSGPASVMATSTTHGSWKIGDNSGSVYLQKTGSLASSGNAYLLFPNVGTSTTPKTLATTDDIINVVANPSSTTATLTGITIGNTSYAVSASGGDHYPTTFTWTNGTTAGPTGSLTGNSGFTAVSFGAIPSASASQSGIVTTNTQTLKGQKTILGGIALSTLDYDEPPVSLTEFTDGVLEGILKINSGVASDNGLYITNSSLDTYIKIYNEYESKSIGLKGYTVTSGSTTAWTANLTLPKTSGTLALTSLIAPDYSASSTYTVGAKVIYNGQLYRCNTAITTAEAWNSSHWTSITVKQYFVDVDTQQSITGTKSFLGKVNIGGGYPTSSTNILDVGKHSGYSGGFEFYNCYSDTAGYIKGLFSSSSTSYPEIKDIKQITFHQGNPSTHQAYTYATTLVGSGNSTANRTITLPDNTGTVALTSDLPQVIDLR